MSEKETVRFLQSLTGGKKQVAVFDGKYRSYSLEESSFHIEYKIERDICVMAAVRFQGRAGKYNQVVREIMATTKPFSQNRLKDVGAKKIIYVLNPQESTVTAIDYSFAL